MRNKISHREYIIPEVSLDLTVDYGHKSFDDGKANQRETHSSRGFERAVTKEYQNKPNTCKNKHKIHNTLSRSTEFIPLKTLKRMK